MATNTQGWPQVSFLHSHGSMELGLDLYATLGRDLTDAEDTIVRRAMDALAKDLLSEATRTHPDSIAWKVQWLREARTMFASGWPISDLRPRDRQRVLRGGKVLPAQGLATRHHAGRCHQGWLEKAILGSDRKNEALSWAAHKRGNATPTLFFEKPPEEGQSTLLPGATFETAEEIAF